ncbi:helix-hairpin-helix domain-containing protein [Candidatus Daviesbacteria bacterium]|nr:helix-hairpin-helix domain-containing protein [Candidatus Daviesbacteria bacterium]
MDGNFLGKIEKFKLPIALSVLGIVLIVGGIFASGINKAKPKDFPKASLMESQKTISVDVSGAVNKPGVYRLTESSRIEDAIKIAGGFSQNSNQEYISKYLNMAQKLSDGSKIYVPLEGEQISNSPSAVMSATHDSKVNINTATQAELEALPGVGPVTASKIISDRPYQAVEDLLNKKIINKSTFEKIKDVTIIY